MMIQSREFALVVNFYIAKDDQDHEPILLLTVKKDALIADRPLLAELCKVLENHIDRTLGEEPGEWKTTKAPRPS